MRPTQHPSNNDVLGAPPGVAIEQCKALPITRARFEDGTPVVCSFWEPSAAERAALAAGAQVRLMCWGMTHAPVSLGVDGVPEQPW